MLETGQLTMGPKVAELERLLARGVRHRATRWPCRRGRRRCTWRCSRSGSSPGDEVLVPAYTFPATANVVALAGARPVLVDVDPVTMNVDPAAAHAAVTPRTKAVIAVHLFGRPARLEELPDLPLLEDAAGALGARRGGRAVRRARRRSAASASTRARSSRPARAAR